jgi:hypothetical protein
MGNWSTLQTDTEITFGYSGGPVFNINGEVVAVSTFGAISPLTQIMEHFLIPINIAHDLLLTKSIENIQGPIDTHYQKGLKYFWNNDYTNAIQSFKNVLQINPHHKYAQNLLTIVQSNIEKRSSNTIFSSGTPESLSNNTQMKLSSSIFTSIIQTNNSLTLNSDIASYLILSILLMYLAVFLIKKYHNKYVSYLHK